jgi:hypothetical protein
MKIGRIITKKGKEDLEDCLRRSIVKDSSRLLLRRSSKSLKVRKGMTVRKSPCFPSIMIDKRVRIAEGRK